MGDGTFNDFVTMWDDPPPQAPGMASAASTVPSAASEGPVIQAQDPGGPMQWEVPPDDLWDPTPENVAQVDAGLAAMGHPAPGEQTMGLVGDIASGNAQSVAEKQAWLNANQVRSVSSDNPLHPIVKNERDDFNGRGGQIAVQPFQPEAFKEPGRMEGEDANAYFVRKADAKIQHDVDQALAKMEHDEGVIQLRDQAANEVGDVRSLGDVGRMGMGEGVVTSAEQSGEAQLGQMKELADATGQVRSNLAGAEATRQDSQNMIQQDRESEARAFKDVQDGEDEIRAKLEAMPEHTMGSVFKSKSVGQKIWAVIGALAGGWTGSSAMVDMITEEANSANRMAREDWERQMGAAQDDTAGAADVYAMSMEQFGNRELASDMDLKFKYEDAERFLKQRIAETALGPAKAQLQEALVGVEMKRREVETGLEAKLALTPREFHRRVDPLGRRERRRLEGEIQDEKKFGRKLSEKAIDTAMAGEKMGAASADRQAARADKDIDQGLARERIELDKKKFTMSESSDLAKQIAPKQAAVQAIDRFLKQDDFSGIGTLGEVETAISSISGWFGPDEAHILEKKVDHMVEKALRDSTGAAAPPEEKEQYMDFIMDGATGPNGEARFRENLTVFKQNMNDFIEVHKNGASEEAVKHLSRKDVLPDVDPMNIGHAPAEDSVRRK